jgi:hypothetical protein
MPEKVDADPTKEFFVRMIVKDISLDDCILDLLDNCLDGANGDIAKRDRVNGAPAQGESSTADEKPTSNERPGNNGSALANAETTDKRYAGYSAELTISEGEFSIRDNCGGISIDEAKGYAFRFGRRPDAPSESDYSIGLYGIGMKRAMFKLGKSINIESSTTAEAFVLEIDVDSWLAIREWDFFLERNSPAENPGTTIHISNLHDEVNKEFTDNVFINKLRRSIARDYSIFLQAGFTVRINGEGISPYEFKLLEGEEFSPVKRAYEDESVHVEITAGLAGLPSDDSSAESQENMIPEVDYYGWFVSCNDRVVIAADKSNRTVWGDENFPVWHPQYNGFMGIVSFRSERPELLPWTTTKRQIDLDDARYRRAVSAMKEVTREYINYTTLRKGNLEEAKKLEGRTNPIPIMSVPIRLTMRLPRLAAPNVDVANITYQKTRREVRKAAEALGNRNMTNKQVGISTFEYYYEQQVED